MELLSLLLKIYLFIGIGIFLYIKIFKKIIKEKRIEKLIKEYEKQKNKNQTNFKNTTYQKNHETYKKPKQQPKQKTNYWEKVKKGQDYESFVADYYRSLGYDVVEHGKMMGRKDMGIDLMAFKENEILLIQCKNFNENTTWKIRQKDIKAFRMDCIDFLMDNPELKREKMKALFIASNDVFHKSAKYYADEKMMKGKKIICKVIPYEKN